MKTLKKTLCLVLAVVMVVGALVLPASAAYKDVDKIDKDYTTAVSTLADWQIMLGDDTGNFKPEAHIQRQEMAAIVYRLLTGDNGGYGHDNSAIYIPLATAKFTDVGAKDWAAGYIGYCADKGIIVGTNAEGTTFEPTRNIPGYDVLCMLLRAIGYGKNKEYQGVDWAKHIAADATRLGLTKGITTKLNIESERQEVAQMTYKAATAARVTWSDAEKDYIPYVDPNDPSSDDNIALIDTSTKDVTSTQTYDKFGRPEDTTTTHTIVFTYPVAHKTFTWKTTNVTPVKGEWWTPVTECDVATKLGIGKTTAGDSASVTTYTNGKGNVGTDKIEALDTVNGIGHQGRHTIAYADRIVYIDTYLARVTSTASEVLDPASHVMIQGATATLQIYSNQVANPNTTTSGNVAVAATPIVATGTIANTGDKYKTGDMLLVNVLTKTPYNAMRPNASFGKDDIVVVDKAATATVTIAGIKQDPMNFNLPTEAAGNLTEVGFTGTDGTAYYYNFTFGYNNGAAVRTDRLTTADIGKTYTVYLDTKGNVMGLTPVVGAANYGVVTAAGVQQVANTLSDYVITYNVLLPNGTTTTVQSVAANGKPYTSREDAVDALTTFQSNAMNPAADKGILVKLIPQAGGYYTLIAAGRATDTNNTLSAVGFANANFVLERGEADTLKTNGAFSGIVARAGTAVTSAYLGTVDGIDDMLVDNTTVFFVANYPYNYAAKEYQFKDFTVTTGFKSIKDLSYNNVIPASSASVNDNTANIDGNTAPVLEVAAFDADRDGYADYVMVLNANHQEVPAAVETFNYAFLLTASKFVTTDSDHNVYNYAIFNGTSGNSLTATASASDGIRNTGLYVYSNTTINGYDKVIFVSGNASTPAPTSSIPDWSIDAVTGTGVTGWLVKDGVLVVGPNTTATGSSMNRGTVALANLGQAGATGAPVNDKFLTLADDVQVYLVNTSTGASVKSGYALTTLDNENIYGQCAIAYQFDANGYVNLIYIIEKGLNVNTHEPATEINTIGVTATNTDFRDTAAVYGCTFSVSSITNENGNTVTASNVTLKAVWQRTNSVATTATTWVDCKEDEIFNSNYRYRIVITVTVKDGYIFDEDLAAADVTATEFDVDDFELSADCKTLTIYSPAYTPRTN